MSGSYALWLTALLTVALSALSVYLVLRISAGSPGSSRDMVVMCADGHLFTTVWIPGVSFKAIRLGRARFQHCPVGDHWTTVRPVDPAGLTAGQRRFAAAHRDGRVP